MHVVYGSYRSLDNRVFEFTISQNKSDDIYFMFDVDSKHYRSTLNCKIILFESHNFCMCDTITQVLFSTSGRTQYTRYSESLWSFYKEHFPEGFRDIRQEYDAFTGRTTRLIPYSTRFISQKNYIIDSQNYLIYKFVINEEIYHRNLEYLYILSGFGPFLGSWHSYSFDGKDISITDYNVIHKIENSTVPLLQLKKLSKKVLSDSSFFECSTSNPEEILKYVEY